MNQYVIDFTGYIFSSTYDIFKQMGVANPKSEGKLWIVEMDPETLVVFVLKYPKAVIYRPMRKE